MDKIQKLESSIEVYQKKLSEHDFYNNLKSIEDIKVFMKNHVFAVWDFMSLLKCLQKRLTCVEIPWLPVDNSLTSRFINEIVLGEESDLDIDGNPRSHFEMYLDAMNEIGADTQPIVTFVYNLQKGGSIEDALKNLKIADQTKAFVLNTFKIINSNSAHKVASSFTFGREDVIPEMFLSIVKSVDPENNQYKKLRYYLERHIELDGDDHGPLALKMISELCGESDQKWEESEEVAKLSLNARFDLWSGINNEINAYALT